MSTDKDKKRLIETPDFNADMRKIIDFKKESARYPSVDDLDSNVAVSSYPGFVNWDDVHEIMFTINEIQIKKFRELGRYGEINVLTSVTDNVPIIGKDALEPKMDGQGLIEAAKVKFLGTFTGIKRGDNLPVDNYIIYCREYDKKNKKPSYLLFKILVSETDKGVREAGEVLDDVTKTDAFRTATEMLKKYPQPQFEMATALADLGLSAFIEALKANKDEQLILYYKGFQKYTENLGLGQHEIENGKVRLKYTINTTRGI